MRRSHLTSVDDPGFEPLRPRAAAPTTRERLTRAAWLATLAIALLPLVLFAQVRLTYLAVPAVLSLSSRWLGSLARWVAILGGGLLAALGAAGVPPSTLLFGAFVVIAIAVAAFDELRITRFTVVVVAVVAVLLVRRVLARAGWHDEVASVTQLATGCLAGITAGLALLRLTRPTEGYAGERHALTLVVGACAAAAAGRIVVEQRPVVFPRWIARAHELTRAAPNPTGPALIELERLQNAGFKDAGLSRVGVLITRDADPTTLTRACFIGHREPQLGPTWVGRVALGEIACRAVKAWPEEGAALLAHEANRLRGSERAMINHLRADILMDAGLTAPALAGYEEARTHGDRLAASDAVRALLDRGRVDEARAVVAALPASDVAHARLGLWLGEASVDDATLSTAWNELVDFTTLVPASRRGIVVEGNGRALAMIDNETGRESLTAVTEDALGFSIALPLPPRRAVPADMTIDVRARSGYRIDFTTSSGARASFVCGLEAPAGSRVVAISGVCGSTTPVHIQPSAVLEGELTAVNLVGAFSAYTLRLP